MSRPYDVAIIGGGFSGALLSVELMNRMRREYRMVIVERKDTIGCGVAYATECASHFLNVPSCRMSLFADRPDHLVNWLKVKYPELAEPAGFIPRGIYGRYVNTFFRQGLVKNNYVHLTHCRDEAVGITSSPGGFAVTCLSGTSLETRAIILATGNSPPSTPTSFADLPGTSYVPFAWAHDALHDIPTSGRVLILGAGLTAIDQVLSLEDSGFDGNIDLFSRRGKLPAVHAHTETWPNHWVELEPQSILSLFKRVRRQVAEAEEEGVDWRSVIDSLRPHTATLWRLLPVRERQRFLRHVRPFWEIARHRLPQKSHQVVARLMREKRLEILAGRITSVTAQDEGLLVAYAEHDSARYISRRYDRVINCTGPSTAERVPNKLTASLVQQRLGRLDPCKIGLETDAVGQLLDPDDHIVPGLYGLGPVTKANNWESTAVAEIRIQARSLGEVLQSL